MENVYQDLQNATSVETLLKADELLEPDYKAPSNGPQDEDDPAPVQSFIPFTRQKASLHLKRIKDLLLFALAFWGLVMIIQQLVQKVRQVHHVHHVHHEHHEHQSMLRQCDCGHSTAEAISLGCKYDSLAAAWLPEHCRDDELTAEFETKGPGPNGSWIYWADSNHTQELSLGEIAAMADDPSARFHMSYDWHVIHCIFYWRKQYRSRFNGKTVEPRDDSEEHIMHCGKVITNKVWGTVAGVALNTNA